MTVRRRTPQRAAVRAALEAAARPLSPAEVLAAARRRVPGLGIATVYRHLRALLDDGRLVEVDLPGSARRYEVADKHHHHHFHCRGCDRVFEVEDCPGDLRGIAPRGFRVESHHITLHGVCRSCARRGRVKRRRKRSG